jgi:hypothetical protein
MHECYLSMFCEHNIFKQNLDVSDGGVMIKLIIF